MHKLPEEVPLLVDNFGTLFLIHFKLRLILSIFWTTSTFCQLALTCSLTFIRSLIRLALPSLRCGCFAAHLLTHFVSSLVRLALPSVTQLSSVTQLPSVAFFARTLHSLRSLFALTLHSFQSLFALPSVTLDAHFVHAIALPSVTQSGALHFTLKALLGHYTTSAHSFTLVV